MDGLATARKLIVEERDRKVGFLDLGRLGLTELPVELFELTHLESLHLGDTYWDAAGNYKQSAQAGKSNKITALPEAVENLHCLRHLTLPEGLSSLETVSHLPALQSLNCSSTQVADLTPLKDLPALQSLNCSSTQVADLTPLKDLPALQSLDCSNTQVADLTPLNAVSTLTGLTANHCELRDFPALLLNHAFLKELYLHQTKIPGIPPEVLSESDYTNCLEQLRNHVADLRSGAEEVRETKLIVLGNGRVGKTQICRRLRGLPFDPTVLSTHGIIVTSEPWTGSTGKELLNIWDFGGQDIYHGAHTLFMRTRAVFLIVWHPEFESTREHRDGGMAFRNCPLSYWLEYVRTLGQADSPVIAVQSQCDRPEQEAKRLPADDEFLTAPFFKQCWYSALKDRGHRALDEALEDAIRHLRERDGVATVGKGRLKVLRQLEQWRNADQKLPPAQRQHRTLTQTEFRNLCDTVGGVASPDSLLEYLHNVGVVFYRNSLFHDRIILDQSWALDAVYAVFDRTRSFRQIASQGGRFTRSLLNLMVWEEYSEAEQRLFLSLMQSCGICFISRRENGGLELEAEYIAPDLLPDRKSVAEQLAGRWNDAEECRRLVFEYQFLHPGLMRCLICDAGQRAGEAGVYWKHGVWVYEKATGCRALIEQEMPVGRPGRITARIQGRRYEDLARWIRDRFENRNRLFGYPGLKPAVDGFNEGRQEPPASQVVWKKGVSAKIQEPPNDIPKAALEPVFADAPATSFPKAAPQVFVSYAWGDSTPEGKKRQQLVDDLCAAVRRHGKEILRDCEQMRAGDRISEFMKRLAQGDLIITVISDRYLKSPYCMYELFRIYLNCGTEPDRFLSRVIPLILPDAQLKDVSDRFAYAVHWKQEKAKLETLLSGNVDILGEEALRKFRMMQNFAHHVSNMLEHLVDKLMPRDFDRMAAADFKEVLDLIGKADKRDPQP